MRLPQGKLPEIRIRRPALIRSQRPRKGVFLRYLEVRISKSELRSSNLEVRSSDLEIRFS